MMPLEQTITEDILGKPGSSTNELRFAVENFLYYEMDLLDRWLLDDWLLLWAEKLKYLVPATDRPNADPSHDLMLVQDGRFILEERVRSLMNGTAWAESPPSTTRHVVSNVRARYIGDGIVESTANFIVHRSREAVLQTFPGHYEYELEVGGSAGFLIRVKKAILDLEELRPHGRVAILL